MSSEAFSHLSSAMIRLLIPPSLSPDYHDAVFVVGALDETLMLRGMRYHPIDIENSVMRAHKRISEW